MLAGCAVGPNFQRPPAPNVDRYTPQPLPAQTASVEVKGGEAQRFVQDMDIPGQWWTLFHSKPLNDLIEQALKANPDLEPAQAALRGAWENVYAQQGAFFPSVEANFNPTRQKTAGVLTSPLANGNYTYSLHTAQVAVAYVPDVFGGTRRQVESLKAQADSQRFQLEATYLTLTSNVVAAAVQEAALRGQIAATKRIIDIQSQSLELMQRQYELGQIASGDIAAQEAALAQVQALLPPLEKQLAQQRDLLARLVGCFPSETARRGVRTLLLAIAARSTCEPSLQAGCAAAGCSLCRRAIARSQCRDRREYRQSAAEHYSERQCRLQRHRNKSIIYLWNRILGIGRQSDSTNLSGGNIVAPATCC